MRIVRVLIFLMAIISFSAISGETISIPSYYVQLGIETGVPADILYALSAKETNTSLSDGTYSPWPYSINFNGKSYFFDDYLAYRRACHQLIDSGHVNFDIGPFQVNYRYHKDDVNTIDDLIDIYQNGLVAARIIKRYYKQTGDWITAAGLYHNPANHNGRATIYSEKFAEFLELIQNGRYRVRG